MVVGVAWLASAYRSTVRTADIRRFLGLRGVRIGAVGVVMFLFPVLGLPLLSVLSEQWGEAVWPMIPFIWLCGFVTMFVVAPMVGLLEAGDAELREYQVRHGEAGRRVRRAAMAEREGDTEGATSAQVDRAHSHSWLDRRAAGARRAG